jgi:hypothetical protein
VTASATTDVLLGVLSVISIALGLWVVRFNPQVGRRSRLGVVRGAFWILLGVSLILHLVDAQPVAGIAAFVSGIGLAASNFAKAIWIGHKRRAATATTSD